MQLGIVPCMDLVTKPVYTCTYSIINKEQVMDGQLQMSALSFGSDNFSFAQT